MSTARDLNPIITIVASITIIDIIEIRILPGFIDIPLKLAMRSQGQNQCVFWACETFGPPETISPKPSKPDHDSFATTDPKL